MDILPHLVKNQIKVLIYTRDLYRHNVHRYVYISVEWTWNDINLATLRSMFIIIVIMVVVVIVIIVIKLSRFNVSVKSFFLVETVVWSSDISNNSEKDQSYQYECND